MKSNVQYRSVDQLTNAELEELQNNLYWELLDSGDLMFLAPNAKNPSEFPMELVFEKYAGTCFVDEDFFCNC